MESPVAKVEDEDLIVLMKQFLAEADGVEENLKKQTDSGTRLKKKY